MTDDLLPGTDPAVHASHDVQDEHRHTDGCAHDPAAHADHDHVLHDDHRHQAHGDHGDEHEGDATTGPDGATATAGLSSRD